MNVAEFTAELTLASGGSLALVLDASESAEAQQAAISALVTGLLSALPARVGCRLYFLGNPAPYPAGDFPLKAAGWFAENRGRGSILAPVAEVLVGQPDTPIVIIGAGRIFDLEDWIGTPLLARATLVTMGDSLQGDASLTLEIPSPAPNDLFQRVYDPVAATRIGGTGFLPLCWSNAGYRLVNVAGAFQLVGEKLEDFAVTVTYLAAQADAQATTTLVSGQSRALPLMPTAPVPQSDAWSGQLTPAEAVIFRAALKREAFTCPSCGEQHAWDTLVCLRGSTILGTPIYPSLRNRNGHFVLFREDGKAVAFRVHPSDVLNLGDGRVAVREGQRGTIYANGSAGRWEAKEALQAYQAVGGGAYAVLL